VEIKNGEELMSENHRLKSVRIVFTECLQRVCQLLRELVAE